MSATNKTPNFNLPLFVGTDIPSWLTDFNGAMTLLDTSLEKVTSEAAAAGVKVDGIQATVDGINSVVATVNTTVTEANKAAQEAKDTAQSAKDTADAAQATAGGLATDVQDAKQSATAANALANQANTKAEGALAKTGGTLSGALDMGGNEINNVADPLSDQDAATKKYVDDKIAEINAKLATFQLVGDQLNITGPSN